VKKSPIDGISAELIDNDLLTWQAKIIGPSGTPYADGIFRLKIQIPTDYPFKPPRCQFITKIYHCNIDDKGRISLDILGKNWPTILVLPKVILSIQSLLGDPNPDDPLMPDIAKLYKTNRAEHDKNARDWTRKYASWDSL